MAELDAVAAHLAPRYRPMVFFAAATGLRPAEWVALERRDVDREARVVYGRHAFTKGRRDHHWKPAQRAAGIEPLRRIYDLRHTFATFALRAGISKSRDFSRRLRSPITGTPR